MRFPSLRSAAVVVSILLAAMGAIVATPSPAAADGAIVFDGGGFGHGVGMGQYGAYGMANYGYTYDVILGWYYQNTATQSLPQPEPLRVQIGQSNSSALVGSGTVVYAVNGTWNWSVPANAEVDVTASGSSIVLSGAIGGTIPPGSTLSAVYEPFGTKLSVSASGRRYDHGVLNMTVPSAGTIQFVVGDLTMDQYLYGLGEVPSSWPMESLKAQAVAGRTYAKEATDRRRTANPSRTYDLDASTIDQAYDGYEKQAGSSSFWPAWKAAVDNTSGRVVTYNGAVIQAFYSSSSGGYTENSENVFVTANPYLKGVPDSLDNNPANPNHHWRRTYSISNLSRWLNRFSDTSVGTLSSIDFLPTSSVSGRVDKSGIRLVGTAGTKTVTGSRFKGVVNSGVASDGSGLSSQFLSTLISIDPSYGIPGSLDGVSRAPGGIRVTGWAIDLDTTQPIEVDVYADATGTATLANTNRPDVGAAFPGYGSNHGYDVVVGAGPGLHSICSYGINTAGPGINRQLGCLSINVNTDPFGSLDSAVRAPHGVGVSGWAIDPDTANPTGVHVYVDGVGYQLGGASVSRPDVGAVYPSYGSNHGYSAQLPASPGSHNVCAYAINTVGAGTNRLLGCQNVTVDPNPFGSLDAVVGGAGSLRVTGWAIDPDTASPTSVHVYVDQFGNDLGPVSAPRGDVGAVFPWYGPNHGYDTVLWPASAGTHNVCAYAINTAGGGTNRLLACKTVQVT